MRAQNIVQIQTGFNDQLSALFRGLPEPLVWGAAASQFAGDRQVAVRKPAGPGSGLGGRIHISSEAGFHTGQRKIGIDLRVLDSRLRESGRC